MRTTHHVRHCCAQNADHLAHGSPLSAFFAEVVCSLAATPPPVGAWPPPNGGNGVIRGVTRRRHADSQRLMLPNPHCHRCGERRRDVMGLAAVSVGGGRSTTGGAGGAEVRQYSPPRTAPGRCRYKIRPADPFSPRARDKIRPVDPFSPPGRWWSRAGRQISRTGCTNMVRLKPTTPLLALNKGPLKPAAPLRPKTAAKTPISHPQRRWQFQSHTDTSEQRRWQFQSHTDTSKQRRSQFQSHTDTSKQRRSRFQPTGPPHLQHPHGARGRARLRRP